MIVRTSEERTTEAMLRIVVAVSLACIALGLQLLLNPVVAVDSYQLFLGAVAVSSIYGGAKPGLVTLLLSLIGKFYFFLPPDILAVDSEFALRTILFLVLAVVICWIGGRFHTTEHRLSTVLTSIADAVIATDETGRITLMNPAAEALTGWARSEAVKRSFSEVIHLRDPGGGSTNAARGGLGPGAVLDSKAGYAIPVAGSVTAIPGRAGVETGAVLVLRDITERRRADQERDRLLNELQSAMAQVKTLSGMLPICASCKKIRDDQGRWEGLETYVEAHSEAAFSHSLCPECVKQYYPEFASEAINSEHRTTGGA